MTDDIRTLHILHTNDIHSHYEQMPRIATCLREQRRHWEGQGAYVLTVDIGDHLDRMSEASEATWGKVNTEIMNQSGYEYVTIGNNEGVTLPKERLDDLYTQANFTVVVGNLRDPGSGSTPAWAVPYAIHQLGDVKIAILAVTAAFSSSYELLGWEVQNPFPILTEQIRGLRDQVHVVLVLSHLGYPLDLEMAREVPGIDVIIGSHTHHLLENGERAGSTLIAQAGKFGQYVGHITLQIDPQAKSIHSSSAEVLASSQFVPDRELTAFIRRSEENARHLLDTSVATLSRSFPVDWARESPFATFVASSLRLWTHADIGMANAGLQLTPLTAGAITRHDLLACLPHPINPCTLTLTGEQLHHVLARAIQPQIVQKELRGFGFRGKMNGWMGVDGMTVRYAPVPDWQICQIDVGGRPLQPDRKYRLATLDMYLFNRLFPELLQGEEVEFHLPEVLREVLAVTLGNDLMVQESFVPRFIRC